jgi:hypothetical protein
MNSWVHFQILKSIHLWTLGGFFEYGNQAGNKMSGLSFTRVKLGYWRTGVLNLFSYPHFSHCSIIPSPHYFEGFNNG